MNRNVEQLDFRDSEFEIKVFGNEGDGFMLIGGGLHPLKTTSQIPRTSDEAYGTAVAE